MTLRSLALAAVLGMVLLPGRAWTQEPPPQPDADEEAASEPAEEADDTAAPAEESASESAEEPDDSGAPAEKSASEPDGGSDEVAKGPAAPATADAPPPPESPASQASQAPAGSLTVVNKGAFNAHVQVTWSGGGDSWSGVGGSRRFEIPGDARDVRLKVENDTGLVFQPRKPIYDGPAQPGSCFVLTGTTLDSSGAFGACP